MKLSATRRSPRRSFVRAVPLAAASPGAACAPLVDAPSGDTVGVPRRALRDDPAATERPPADTRDDRAR